MGAKNRNKAVQAGNALPKGAGLLDGVLELCSQPSHRHPRLTVTVMEKFDVKHKFQDADVIAVKVAAPNQKRTETTNEKGKAQFDNMEEENYTISFTLVGADREQYSPSQEQWPVQLSQRRTEITVYVERKNVVRPRIELTITKAEQYFEVWVAQTECDHHPFKAGGRVTFDPKVQFAQPFDGNASNADLVAKKKLPLKESAPGKYTFTLQLPDPGDRFIEVRQNPADVTAWETEIRVVDEQNKPIPGVTIDAHLEDTDVSLDSKGQPIEKWMTKNGEIKAVMIADPSDSTWELVEVI
jgi:hypothetical protein